MKSLLAFMKKEWMEQVRSGRLLILVIIFILLGIMNPAVAKLTPWLLEMMADSLEARYDGYGCYGKRNGFMGAVLQKCSDGTDCIYIA